MNILRFYSPNCKQRHQLLIHWQLIPNPSKGLQENVYYRAVSSAKCPLILGLVAACLQHHRGAGPAAGQDSAGTLNCLDDMCTYSYVF